MSVREILLLGNPLLYERSAECRREDRSDTARTVSDPEGPAHDPELIIRDLADTLADFRKRNGFGRAVAAPQIGERSRIIYLDTRGLSKPELTIAFINPVLEFPDAGKMILWDDCMSFPGLLVKVERYRRCVVRYRDENWQEHRIAFEDGLSELIQHEYDHLDGILAVQRAVDGKSFAFADAPGFTRAL